LVCCINECEVLLDEIEHAVEAPTATPEDLLAVVSTLNPQSTVDDDMPFHMDGSLVSQLEQIAATHGGKVPLHGRLFAQWLHYVFPRECPFPHKVGVASTVTPAEYGDSFFASAEEMTKHVAERNASDVPAAVRKEDMEWMSQWSPDEELIAEHIAGLRAPWERSYVVGGVLLVLASMLGLLGFSRKGVHASSLLPDDYTKAHFV
jgi:hypothetical protein